MVEPKRLTETQKRYRILFENHVDSKTGEIFDKDFAADILRLRTLASEMRNPLPAGNRGKLDRLPPLVRFLLKYKLPEMMDDFIYQFALNGTIDLSLISSGMLLVDGREQVAVGSNSTPEEAYRQYIKEQEKYGSQDIVLVFRRGVTLRQAKDFLSEHWYGFVLPHQSMSRFFGGMNTRIRPSFNAKRDYRVFELAKTMKPKLVAEQIIKEYPGYYPTYVEIAKIKKRLTRLNVTI